MKNVTLFILILATISMAACASERKDKAWAQIYEGLKARERMVHPASEPPRQESQTYEQYKRERHEELKKEAPGQDETGR